MKKFKIHLFLLIISAISLIVGQPVFAEGRWPQPPEVSAASAIVIEADSGAILYGKNAHDRNYPASITKIMTTLLALENCPLNDIVSFSSDAINKVEGTQVGITEGEELTLDQCLYGVMLGSANEIAYAVAEHVGGSMEQFVEMMNLKAAELGCTDTHFNNSHGLPDENHYTSAYDMALIARAAYENETFRTITATKYYTIPPTNLWPEERGVGNHHKMLTNTSYHYDYCTGGKTGFTSAARNTLVTYAEKDGMKLICVIMKDDETYSQYIDSTALLNYAFQNFQKVNVCESDLSINLNTDGLFPLKNTPFSADSSNIFIDEQSFVVVPNGTDLSILNTDISYDTKKENEIAQINYHYDDNLSGTVSVFYEAPKEKPQTAGMLASATTVPNQPEKTKNYITINVRILIYIGLALILISAILVYLIFFLPDLRYSKSNTLHFSSSKSKRRRRF